MNQPGLDTAIHGFHERMLALETAIATVERCWETAILVRHSQKR